MSSGLSAALHATGDVALAKRHWRRALDPYSELGTLEPDGIRVRLAALA